MVREDIDIAKDTLNLGNGKTSNVIRYGEIVLLNYKDSEEILCCNCTQSFRLQSDFAVIVWDRTSLGTYKEVFKYKIFTCNQHSKQPALERLQTLGLKFLAPQRRSSSTFTHKTFTAPRFPHICQSLSSLSGSEHMILSVEHRLSRR